MAGHAGAEPQGAFLPCFGVAKGQSSNGTAAGPVSRAHTCEAVLLVAGGGHAGSGQRRQAARLQRSEPAQEGQPREEGACGGGGWGVGDTCTAAGGARLGGLHCAALLDRKFMQHATEQGRARHPSSQCFDCCHAGMCKTHGAGRLALSSTTASSVRSIHLSSADTRAAGAAATVIARGAAAARPPLPLRRCWRRHCTARCAGVGTRLFRAGAVSSRSWAQPAGRERGRTGVRGELGLRAAREHGSKRSCMHIAMRVPTLQLGKRASHDWARPVVGALQTVLSGVPNISNTQRSGKGCAE